MPTVKASKLKWNCSSVFFVCVYLCMRNMGKSKNFQTLVCFFNIFIIFIKLSSSVGQAAGLGAMGLLLKNGIYHPADFVSCVTCYGCGCVWNMFMYKNCKHIHGGNHLGCIKKNCHRINTHTIVSFIDWKIWRKVHVMSLSQLLFFPVKFEGEFS